MFVVFISTEFSFQFFFFVSFFLCGNKDEKTFIDKEGEVKVLYLQIASFHNL